MTSTTQSGRSQLEALYRPPAHHYTAGHEAELEAERIRNTKGVHYPWERLWHESRFFGPWREYGLLGYVFPSFRYSYYDTPDGKDAVLKCLWMTKYCSLAGLAASLYHGCTSEAGRMDQGLQKSIRYARLIGTPVAVGLMYVSASNILADVRVRNDLWNNALGGLAAGGVMGSCIRSAPWGWVWAGGIAVVGMFANWASKEQGVKINFGYIPRDQRAVWGYENGGRFDKWYAHTPQNNRPATTASASMT